MPLFSIVIATYGNAEYLPACLDSLKAQTLADWEAIIVVDASPDNAADIARSYAAQDPRFTVIDKEVNGGPHLARRDGVAAAGGTYVTFLDADDELAANTLESLARTLPSDKNQILHFGLKCVGSKLDRARADSFESWANTDAAELSRVELLHETFSTSSEYGKDWNVCHRVFGADLAKRAFAQMTDSRLARAEDAYELFCLASLSSGEVTHDEIKGYLYHIGRGVTNDRVLKLEKFASETVELMQCADAAAAFASELDDDAAKKAASTLRERLAFSAANECFGRLTAEDRKVGMTVLADAAGNALAATEVMRFARDAAYAALVSADSDSAGLGYQELFDRAESLASSRECALPLRYSSYRKAATRHIEDIAAKKRVKDYDKQDIRIFISTHKDVETFDSEILQPVQVGCANRDWLFPWALHDNDGNNISEQNPMYCELTTQYWAWKNIDAEYYGFCHYRRYFDFSPTRHKENAWGEIIDSRIDAASQERYGLDDETIRKAVEGYDCITTEVKDLSQFPGENHTPLAQYKAAPLLHVSDLEHVISILNDMHPDYAEDAEAFLNGTHSCFCNMFIMRKAVFHAYCEWLFPILERFVAETDFSHYSVEALRTPGHLSERLLNIYLMHQQRIGTSWKTKQLQCVHFEKPERVHLELDMPIEAAHGRRIVPVVFAADDGYVPMVTTTVRSMLDNADKTRFYDIVILTSNISWEHQELMRENLTAGANNVSLRFHDVSAVIDQYDLATNNEHIGIETYYRFIIQLVMPGYDKVLYLDSDLIVEGDVSELYDTELGDNLLAATRDVDYLGNLNMNDGIRLAYTKSRLKMDNPYDYFQAGVLLLNIKAMSEAYTTAQWLEFASVRDYIYDDQDVLNTHCQGRVLYLDQAWNVMHDCCGRVGNVFTFAPADVFKAYMAARNQPKIRHYAGCDKPWSLVKCDWAAHYWKYAKETPFYEELLARLCGNASPARAAGDGKPPKAISENNPIRKVVDPLMPLGTRRREVAKAVGRKLRGRS